MRNDASPLQIPTVYLRQNRIPTEADTAAQIWSHENVEVHPSLMISVRTVFHAYVNRPQSHLDSNLVRVLPQIREGLLVYCHAPHHRFVKFFAGFSALYQFDDVRISLTKVRVVRQKEAISRKRLSILG
jgi:hypothetical protein